MSNLYGLFSLLSEPTGGKIMYRAGHSNTPAIAKKRYTASLLHMMKWYEDDLVPGSKLSQIFDACANHSNIKISDLGNL